jgi:hypothetical protein
MITKSMVITVYMNVKGGVSAGDKWEGEGKRKYYSGVKRMEED